MTSTPRVAIAGISGFSGIELAKILDRDPRFTVTTAVADRWKNEPLGKYVPGLSRYSKLVVRPMSDVVAACSEADFALLATPAEASAKIVPELLSRDVRVVDLSGAFRLEDPAMYPRWYNFEHPAPELLAEARFGLPEVAAASGNAPPASRARLIANPGCYATAAIASLAPLVHAKAIETDALYLDGKSGVTGAGRKIEEKYLFTEVDENLSAYRVHSHQHTPEIEQALARVAGRQVTVTFVPHLLPVRRGLMVTSFARLSSGFDPARVPGLFHSFYEGAAMMEVTEPEAVTISSVAYTPNARVGAKGDARTKTAVAIGALDNLLKGAASQAVQNLASMISEKSA